MGVVEVIMIISWVVYLASLSVSLVVFRNRKAEKFGLHNFFWYCLLAFILNSFFLLNLFGITKITYLGHIINTSVLFHFCFLGYFILAVLESKFSQRIGWAVFLFFYLASVWGIYDQIVNKSQISFITTSAGLFILATIYYLDLFESNKPQPFWRFPSFWIISGAFILNSINIPLYLFAKFLFKSSLNLYHAMVSMHSVAYILLHIFFIKGMLCRIRLRNSFTSFL